MRVCTYVCIYITYVYLLQVTMINTCTYVRMYGCTYIHACTHTIEKHNNPSSFGYNRIVI